MTQQMMSNALFEAAQQIEGKVSGGKRKEVSNHAPIAPAPTESPGTVPESTSEPKAKKVATSRSRALRLEQNRKAARESRRRKKAMVEELQRSLMFFSKSNAALKQQNEILTRQVLDAQSNLAKIGKPLPQLDPKITEDSAIKAETRVAKDEEESVAAQTSGQDFASMRLGATMQAMANFQQAAQAAMEAASRNMKAHGVVVNPHDEAGPSYEE